MTVSVAQLRAFALSRSLGERADVRSVIERLGYVQADPIRAPARAQDLILMQRARAYRAGDLERRYPRLGVEEDMLHNYGFVPRDVQRLVHPRAVGTLKIDREAPGLPEQVLEFVRERGVVRAREVETHFGRTRVLNYWGGTSAATTRALEALHYRGELRVVKRENGVRVYELAHHLREVREDPASPAVQAGGLVELLLRQYAPIPQASLGYLVTLLAYGAPHLRADLRAALRNLNAQRATVEGVTYLWPAGETPDGHTPARVRLLAPFDPVVWDRRRFALLHGWAYKFEAYTPAAKRQFGYYALPLLWGERAIGWANLSVQGGNGTRNRELQVEVGFVHARPRSKAFERALNAELDRYRAFLGLTGGPAGPDGPGQ